MKTLGFGLAFLATTSAGAQSRLDAVFEPDVLGADRAYLEKFTGVARNTDTYDNSKIYKVDGCEVTAYFDTKNDTVKALRIELSQKCTFNLNAYSAKFRGRLGKEQS